MITFIVNFAITFICIMSFAWLLIYCRRRSARTRHGLTGMCHSTGGTMCASCSGEMGNESDGPRLQTTIRSLKSGEVK